MLGRRVELHQRELQTREDLSFLLEQLVLGGIENLREHLLRIPVNRMGRGRGDARELVSGTEAPVARDPRRPVGVGLLVLDDPSVDELAVGPPAHLFLFVERPQRDLELGQAIERHAREIVMLEVVIRVQVREVPEPAAAHQRAPLGRIARVDVVVLAQPIESEGDREHEEHRHDAGPHGGVEAEQIPEHRQRPEVKGHRQLALERDLRRSASG